MLIEVVMAKLGTHRSRHVLGDDLDDPKIVPQTLFARSSYLVTEIEAC